MELVYFVLFISILIFIHEFGHFAFAKLFGVKVLTFSIGFGPKILKVRGKETEYCIGLLPFGGFVKMLEEGKAQEPILPEDKTRTFEAQSLWKRVVIVLAGPAMNIVFPIALYTSVYLEDREFLSPVVGVVFPGKPADGKLHPGDTILAVGDMQVSSFPDVQKAFAKNAGVPMLVSVERDGKPVSVTITPSDEIEVVEPSELDLYEHVGRIGIAPTFAAPVIGISRTDSPAWRAGLRTFDRITAVNGRKVETFIELQRLLTQNRGDNVNLTYVRPIPVPNALGGLCDIAVLETGIASLAPRPREEGAATRDGDPDARAKDVLDRTGIESAEMYVASVPEGSSEWRAGLRAGDRVTHLDGVPQRMWKVDRRGGSVLDDNTLVGRLKSEPNRVHELVWTRDGERMSGTFQLRKERWDELGQPYERYVFRSTHWAPRAPSKFVPNPHTVAYAVKRGFEETKNAIRFNVVGFVRILQGRVSIATVSGPITLYDVAGDAASKGATYFVWAMAVTSVNLGLINLLPIPVLDGGHLMLFLVEWVRRKPVSLRTRELSSLVGMTVLVLLMLLAFKNDVARKWDVIVLQAREIVQ
ncbi:Intramembrane protease RasP/YluC, implicated in cell division based on FtsL cleavage [Labilithrix luteola]|uniref:Intramembrane protease RasP/YluC, implicated in cell division based on FtsL cleavage n=1 Tax=Labilithrix luteola TaxID=1391654 RepID=A0A0K1PYF0_9BACT|nr:RIP metalloprotease RseP [Labilithrix luteola]AKU98555.1 Intramembrane protease RasP/YluC, implicated in cell division based on FtsL cleavage [Labilithrix luteola]